MNRIFCILTMVFIGVFLTPMNLISQEKESAEISLEEYSDEFQENFFEALKNSGIHNYDKAINFLLECKNLQPENEVVDFELGKNYLKLNQYYKAEDYILKAVEAAPDNIWYLDALLEVYRIQNNTLKSIEVAKKLAAKNIKYKENLMMIYARSRQFKEALMLLDDLDEELGVSKKRKDLRVYFTTLLVSNKEEERKKTLVLESNNNTSFKKNPLQTIQKEIDELIENESYEELIEITEEAIELYPSQSSFYYANGLAQNKTGKYKNAISSLETALDFLIDNTNLENNIYRQLSYAYTSLGNTKKANEYLKKERKGS